METIFATLKDTRTGQYRVIPREFESLDSAQHMFGSGNFSCDCSRSRFYSNGEEELLCNEIGRNAIELISLERGYSFTRATTEHFPVPETQTELLELILADNQFYVVELGGFDDMCGRAPFIIGEELQPGRSFNIFEGRVPGLELFKAQKYPEDLSHSETLLSFIYWTRHNAMYCRTRILLELSREAEVK